MRACAAMLLLLAGCDIKTSELDLGDDTGTDTGDSTADADGDGAVAGLDCDDADPSAYPGALEECDLVDNDCDGDIDEGYDADSDGTTTCGGDCDDTDPSVRPGVTESCDGVDNNCDGQIDEGYSSTWFADSDDDGYGNPTQISESCTQPPGYVADNTDCDDTEFTANPGWEEQCSDSIDNDCDGDVDEDCTGGGGGGGKDAGYETFLFSSGGPYGFYNCDLYWDTKWSEYTGSICSGCDFAFDVAYTYDSSASSEDGTCSAATWPGGGTIAGNHQFRYAYSRSYGSYGESMLLDYYGSFYWWFYAGFSAADSELVYWYGYENYPYSGRYYTYSQYGQASISP